jgi:hypothetical protein
LWRDRGDVISVVVVGFGRIAIVGVAVDTVVDGLAPAVGAEGVDVLVLREADSLHESLKEASDGAGDAGFDMTLDDGGNDARERGREIAGGEVVAGEEVGKIRGEEIGGCGAGFFLSVVETEARIGGRARSAATAAVSKGKETERVALQ